MSSGLQMTWVKAKLAYGQMAPRDQLALKALSGFVGIIVLVYGLILPCYKFHSEAQAHYAAERELHQWMQQQRGPARRALQAKNTHKPKASKGSALSKVNTSAKSHRLTIKRLQPEKNGDLRLWLEDAEFNQSLKWLNSLERQGLTVKEIVLDQQKPGRVNIRATLGA